MVRDDGAVLAGGEHPGKVRLMQVAQHDVLVVKGFVRAHPCGRKELFRCKMLSLFSWNA